MGYWFNEEYTNSYIRTYGDGRMCRCTPSRHIGSQSVNLALPMATPFRCKFFKRQPAKRTSRNVARSANAKWQHMHKDQDTPRHDASLSQRPNTYEIICIFGSDSWHQQFASNVSIRASTYNLACRAIRRSKANQQQSEYRKPQSNINNDQKYSFQLN